MTNKFAKLFAALTFAFGMSAAHATLMNINFTASGSATGVGTLTLDSSLLVTGEICCSVPPAGIKSLNLDLNFGAGDTYFHLSDLSGTTFVLNIDGSKNIIDLNFWGTNAAGVNLMGVSAFHDQASGKMGANGTVAYSIQSVTPTAAVPEPASIALLGLGLLGMAGIRRRQQ